MFLKEKKEEEKKEESKEEKKEEEKKEEKKEEEPAPEIVLKVDMHCEACARKVARALKGFEGHFPFSTHYVLSSLFEFSHYYYYFYFSLKI